MKKTTFSGRTTLELLSGVWIIKHNKKIYIDYSLKSTFNKLYALTQFKTPVTRSRLARKSKASKNS